MVQRLRTSNWRNNEEEEAKSQDPLRTMHTKTSKDVMQAASSML